MSTIVLGNNRFVDCPVLIGRDDQPILTVRAEPLAISLMLPDIEGVRPVRIIDNEIRESAGVEGLQVIEARTTVAIVHGEGRLLAFATRVEPEHLVGVTLDLRPLGVAIFTDATRLHVGDNVISGNVVERAGTGIRLASRP